LPERPIEYTDLAKYLGISVQSAAGYLRWNYDDIGLEVEKIQPNPLLIPRCVYSVAGKTDESYLLKKKQMISEIRKTLDTKKPVKKETVDYDSRHEPTKKNENKVPYYIMELAKQSESRRKDAKNRSSQR
jgi:hypothetical protein